MSVNGSNITVYMKADAQSTGKQHEHKGVQYVIEDGVLKVRYVHTRLDVNYPLTSIERWEKHG